METLKIKSITGAIHDTSYGGYPYKVIVMIEVSIKEFNKICPIVSPAKHTICGRQAARRDLGSLVINVNNAVYDINSAIPAHNPSIDSKGDKRAKNGIKTMEFVYFFKDHDTAANLGYEQFKMKNGEVIPKQYQYVDLLPKLEDKGA